MESNQYWVERSANLGCSTNGAPVKERAAYEPLPDEYDELQLEFLQLSTDISKLAQCPKTEIDINVLAKLAHDLDEANGRLKMFVRGLKTAEESASQH